MRSDLKSLSKIFTETIFRIPDYQRGYAWGDKQLRDFWNDLEQLPANKKHYTGVLTVEPVPKDIYSKWEDDLWIIESKRYEPLYIVDGQQRITTIIILLQVLIESLSQEEMFNYSRKRDIIEKYLFETKGNQLSRSFIFGYEKDNPSYEYLKREIFLQEGNSDFNLERTAYTDNLSYAKLFFVERIAELSFEKREELFTKITQGLEFNIFYIEPSLDVFVTFETMNNRGKPLSYLELLKTRLIYLSTRFYNEEESDVFALRKNINESWKYLFNILGIINQQANFNGEYSLSDDDTFLLVHYLYYFSKDLVLDAELDDTKFKIFKLVRYGYFKDNLLSDIFSSKRLTLEANPLTIAEISEYVKNIKLLSKVYCYTLNPDKSNWNDDIKIKLSQLNRIGTFDEILLTVFIMQDSNSSTSEKLQALTWLEKVAFIRTLSVYYSDSIPNLQFLAIKLAANKETVMEISKSLSNCFNKLINHKQFEENLKKIGSINTRGYYGWKGVKYFLYEYEQSLKSKLKENRSKLNWNEYSFENYDVDYKSVEHIYPTVAKNKYWKEMFANYTTQEKNRLRNSLGNLLPLSQPKNSSLSNKSFLEKKSINNIGYRYGCYSEIEICEFDEWGAKEIAKRGLKLLSFLEERWEVNLGNEQKKLVLLGIEFILSREHINSISTLLK